MDAKGYEQAPWWEGDEAKAWLRGDESAVESLRQDYKRTLLGLKELDEEEVVRRMRDGYYGDVEPEDALRLRALTEAEIDAVMREVFQSGEPQTQPAFWDNPRFNNPSQPVVGVCWHEARAYCAWLSAQTGLRFRLPTEAQWEAAARGEQRREYAYGPTFDATRCNTLESRILCPTPVGLYGEGHTPEGVADLSSNVWEWCADWYDAEEYQRRAAALMTDPQGPESGTHRVLRGGSWNYPHGGARAAFRYWNRPVSRLNLIGFRVVSVPVP